MICWNCESEFEGTITRWVASAFEGEDISVYVCPVCDAAQYELELEELPMQKLIERYTRQKAKYEAELNSLLQQIMKGLPEATDEEKKALEELGVKLPKAQVEKELPEPKAQVEKETSKKYASR